MLALIAFVLVVSASANIDQGIKPHKNTTIKGIPPAGWTLKPIEKTNQ